MPTVPARDQAAQPPAELAAGGVLLRRRAEGDLEAVHEAVVASLPELRAWMPWAAGYDEASAREYVQTTTAAWERGEEFAYAVVDPTDGTVVGGAGLHRRIGPGGLEIGYWVRTDRTGRGVATRAAAALAAAALALPGVTHVEIHHDEANPASGAVARKLGFHEVARAPGKPEAPAESGVEVRWRLDRDALAATRISALLDHRT